MLHVVKKQRQQFKHYRPVDTNVSREKGRWMNVELSERDKDTDKQERRERINKESRYNRNYERGNSGVPGERVYKRKKNDGQIYM
jgi:hypothetical protein